MTEFSRTRGGPTSMGWFGRAGTSFLLLIALGLVYYYVFGLMLGATGLKYFLLYLVVAGPAFIYALGRVWRPTRIR
ncbi:MAG: hypothetical protein M3Q23_12440 [Actinomycetota bacterium]|nr:hypothetical protein [Actinomycetota bacterium]